MNPTRILAACALLAGSCALSPVASASFIVDTGEATYSRATAVYDSGESFQSVAQRFTTTETYDITSLAVFGHNGVSGATYSQNLLLSLATGPDSPSNSDFTTLVSGLAMLTTSGPFDNHWAVATLSPFRLYPGTYWLVVAIPPHEDPLPAVALPYNAPNPMDAFANNVSDLTEGWQIRSPYLTDLPEVRRAFGARIEGTVAPVPLPGTFTLLLAGLGFMAVRRRLAA